MKEGRQLRRKKMEIGYCWLRLRRRGQQREKNKAKRCVTSSIGMPEKIAERIPRDNASCKRFLASTLALSRCHVTLILVLEFLIDKRTFCRIRMQTKNFDSLMNKRARRKKQLAASTANYRIDDITTIKAKQYCHSQCKHS